MSADLVTEALARLEAIIERGRKSFLEVGDALLKIRSDRLYLETHETFAEYCQDRWGFSDSRARQLVISATTVSRLTAKGLPAPANERQAAELAKVPEPDRERVWSETLARTGGKPTAAAVREVAEPKPVEPERATAPEPAPQEAPEDVEALHTRLDIEAARRVAQSIVSEFRSQAVAVVRGSRLGEKGLVTRSMVDELRTLLDLLEGEL
jgi:hypothetical protein